MIQLPSKSTHILQPLDVGCFGLLQKAYERYLREWLLQNPLAAIRKVDFLELLFHARADTYTVSTIQRAWKTSGCWPIDLNRARGIYCISELEIESSESANVVGALDTPLAIRRLAREVYRKGVIG